MLKFVAVCCLLFGSIASAGTSSLEDLIGKDEIEISPVTYQGKRVEASAAAICALAGYQIVVSSVKEKASKDESIYNLYSIGWGSPSLAGSFEVAPAIADTDTSIVKKVVCRKMAPEVLRK